MQHSPNKLMYHIKNNLERFFLILLILSTLFLRFKNLGYSEYSTDEPGAFLFRGQNANETTKEFILRQRKGPMQVVVAYIPYLLTGGSYQNELAMRIPFSLFNTGAVILFYFLIKRLSENKKVAFIAAFFLSFNGFIVGFGRIVQYQNLNLFFSILATYFYTTLLYPKEKHKIKRTVAGTVALSLSILSHWDAFYFFPIIAIIFLKFLFNKSYEKRYKIRLILFNVLVGVLVLAPFMVPYIRNYQKSPANQSYFNSRVDFKPKFDRSTDIKRVILYNPFLMVETYVVLGFLGLLYDLISIFVKKLQYKFSGFFTLWFIVVTLLFLFVIGYPGTHIYNFLIPAIVLASFGFLALDKIFSKKLKLSFLKIPLYTSITLVLIFLFWQSHQIFVDYKQEYPWHQAEIFDLKTQEYSHEDVEVQRNLLGFPMNRGWKKINEFINEENVRRGKTLTYYTNDQKSITNFYMNVSFSRNSRPYYAVGIKNPYNFVTDYKFSQIDGKSTIKKIKVSGETRAQIFIVKRKD